MEKDDVVLIKKLISLAKTIAGIGMTIVISIIGSAFWLGSYITNNERDVKELQDGQLAIVEEMKEYRHDFNISLSNKVSRNEVDNLRIFVYSKH